MNSIPRPANAGESNCRSIPVAGSRKIRRSAFAMVTTGRRSSSPNNSARLTLRARATFVAAVSEGLCSPRSRLESVARLTPAAAASASKVNPCRCRAARTRAPKRTATVGSGTLAVVTNSCTIKLDFSSIVEPRAGTRVYLDLGYRAAERGSGSMRAAVLLTTAARRGCRPYPPQLLPLLGGILALAAAMGIGRFAYTPLLPAMQQAAGLDPTQAGLLAAANYAGYLVGALLAAFAVPAAGRTRILLVSAVGVAATPAMMATTTDLATWSVVRFIAGLASAGVLVLASGLVLDDLRRQGRASLSGWLFSGVGLGIVVSGAVVRLTGETLG